MSFILFLFLSSTIEPNIILFELRFVLEWLLLTLERTLTKLQRRFNQTNSAYLGFFKKPTLIKWFASWADKVNQILRCDWLPERARWRYLTRCVPQENSIPFWYIKCFRDHFTFFPHTHCAYIMPAYIKSENNSYYVTGSWYIPRVRN